MFTSFTACRLRLDFDEKVEETNEFDNIWFSEYMSCNGLGAANAATIATGIHRTPHPSTSLDYCFIGTPYSSGSVTKFLIPYSPACDIEFRAGHVEERPGAGKPRSVREKAIASLRLVSMWKVRARRYSIASLMMTDSDSQCSDSSSSSRTTSIETMSFWSLMSTAPDGADSAKTSAGKSRKLECWR